MPTPRKWLLSYVPNRLVWRTAAYRASRVDASQWAVDIRPETHTIWLVARDTSQGLAIRWRPLIQQARIVWIPSPEVGPIVRRLEATTLAKALDEALRGPDR